MLVVTCIYLYIYILGFDQINVISCNIYIYAYRIIQLSQIITYIFILLLSNSIIQR